MTNAGDEVCAECSPGDTRCDNGNAETCTIHSKTGIPRWVLSEVCTAIGEDCVKASTCSGGACTEVYAATGTTCTDVNGDLKSCDASGNCVNNCIPDCTGRECGNSLSTCTGTCGTCLGTDECSAGNCIAYVPPNACRDDDECSAGYYCYILDDGSLGTFDKGDLIPIGKIGLCKPLITVSTGTCPGTSEHFIGIDESFLWTNGIIEATSKISNSCADGNCPWCLDSDSYRMENNIKTEYNSNWLCGGGIFNGICLSRMGTTHNDETGTTIDDECVPGSDSRVIKYFLDGEGGDPDELESIQTTCPGNFKCLDGACNTFCWTDDDCVGSITCNRGTGECIGGNCGEPGEPCCATGNECNADTIWCDDLSTPSSPHCCEDGDVWNEADGVCEGGNVQCTADGYQTYPTKTWYNPSGTFSPYITSNTKLACCSSTSAFGTIGPYFQEITIY